MEEQYSVPDLLEKYGNCYTAACMEKNNEYQVSVSLAARDADGFLAWADQADWNRFTDDAFNTAFELLKEAAVGYEQVSRDLHMMYAAAGTDGAYAEIFFDTLLPIQYEADPNAFLAALNELPEDVYMKVGPNLPFIR